MPTTVLESLSCGTPVVGFEVGGVPDMIRHKENGYLAKYKNAGDIVEGIKFCLNNKIKGYTFYQNLNLIPLLKSTCNYSITYDHQNLNNSCLKQTHIHWMKNFLLIKVK